MEDNMINLVVACSVRVSEGIGMCSNSHGSLSRVQTSCMWEQSILKPTKQMLRLVHKCSNVIGHWYRRAR